MTNEEVSKKTNKLNHTKHIANVVGADASVRPQNQRGITLIALVITIIVILILVAVIATIAIVINGGLFGPAKDVKSQTQYVNGNKSKNQNDDTTGGGSEMLSYDATPKDEENGTLTANATYESGEYTATIPAGFKVSEKKEEQEIETGLVIKDANGNEFVWIPIEGNLVNPYSSSSSYSEPTKLTDTYDDSGAAYDSQATLDYLYGKDYYTYEEDFKYEEEYAKMVEKVNEYHGFYIGRYETTIDGNEKIGSKYDTTILTADKIIKEGTNENNSEPYYYRWYGLYYASKNANVTGNGTDVQTAMIYGQLWDKTMDFIRKQNKAGKTSYNVDESTSSWHHGSVVNSGTLNPGVNGDVALNIWDLETNGYEWTHEADYTSCRFLRGGHYLNNGSIFPASSRYSYFPYHTYSHYCSRLALYIKN